MVQCNFMIFRMMTILIFFRIRFIMISRNIMISRFGLERSRKVVFTGVI